MITLDQLLAARDSRRELQLRLLSSHPEKTLVVLTVNIPGSEKRSRESYDIGMEGVRLLCGLLAGRDNLKIIRDFNTGFEAFLLTSLGEEDAKRLCVGIEEEHPLGRLMDIDVIGHDGVPLSRKRFGREARRCLMCGEDARICMRSGRHTLQELTHKNHQMHNEYFQRT